MRRRQVGDPRRRLYPTSMVASTKRAMSRTTESFDYLVPGATDPVAVESSLLGPLLAKSRRLVRAQQPQISAALADAGYLSATGKLFQQPVISKWMIKKWSRRSQKVIGMAIRLRGKGLS